MKAVILAGGVGTRLMPLTEDEPKPLMTVVNNPLIDYQIRLLHKHGIGDINIMLQHKPSMIEDFLNSRYGHNQFFMAVEQNPMGTAGCIKNIEQRLNDTFLVLSADALTDINLDRLIERHKKSGAIASMAVKRMENCSEYGLTDINSDHFIVGFEEKPENNEAGFSYVNCGIYVFEPEIFEYIECQKFYDFGKDVFPKLIEKNKKIAAFSDSFYWQDCGRISSLFQANIDALARNINFKAFEGGLGAILKACDTIVDSTTAAVMRHADAKISSFSSVFPFTVLAKNTSLSSHCVAANCVVLKDTYLEASAVNCIAKQSQRFYVNDAIIPEHNHSFRFLNY